MRSVSRAATAALLAVALASPCWAGQVKLEIRGGLVTLSAKDASVREILAEWARIGQTRIVNAERVPGGLINLELNGVPEARALDIVLRAVAGYVAAPRQASAAAGSQYDRIMIMAVARPASGGPSPVGGAAAAPQPQQYNQRGRMGGYQPQPSLMVDDQDEPVVQPQPQPQPQQVAPGAGGASAPQPGMPTTAAPQPGMPTQGPQPTPLPPGQQPGQPAAGRPGVMTPGAPPKPPGSPGGPGGV